MTVDNLADETEIHLKKQVKRKIDFNNTEVNEDNTKSVSQIGQKNNNATNILTRTTRSSNPENTQKSQFGKGLDLYE